MIDIIATYYLEIGLAILFIGIPSMLIRFYHKVDQGQAMIINPLTGEPRVTFTGGMVIPVINRMEIMEISLKTIDIDRRGSDGLICQDNIRADIKVAFFVRVNKSQEDVLKVAQSIGCARASDQRTLEDLFNAKFSEALKTVGKSLDFEDLYKKRGVFRDRILEEIGKDLNGYVLEDAAIDYLEQTPIEKLDPSNILDSQGIRKITDLTAIQRIETNELKRDEEMRIKKKDVETTTNILELERQEKDARAKQQREIASVIAREKAEQEKIEAEEEQKAEEARIKKDEFLSIQSQNKQREVEIAERNRLRAVAVEEERVTRARDLEIVERKKEVTIREIDNEKEVEAKRREIAEIVRGRIEVDRTVAEQEESIKELRKVAEAEREKKAKVLNAEAAAQEDLVMEVKAAEALQLKAEFKAKEQATLAEAERISAEKLAQAKMELARGTEAEKAAQGLAEARVEEAKAHALEKSGQAEALVLKEKALSEAQAIEARGLAQAKAQEALAAAEQKQGLAQAHVLKEKMNAEAQGLVEKFNAMSTMSSEARAHEEYRMRLEKEFEARLCEINANKEIAAHQATVLSSALNKANIDIVGGSGDYFDSFVKALSVGKSVDGTLNKSDTLQTLFKDYLNGNENFVEDLKHILSNVAGASQEVQNLAVTSFLAQKMQAKTPAKSVHSIEHPPKG